MDDRAIVIGFLFLAVGTTMAWCPSAHASNEEVDPALIEFLGAFDDDADTWTDPFAVPEEVDRAPSAGWGDEED